MTAGADRGRRESVALIWGGSREEKISDTAMADLGRRESVTLQGRI